MAALDPALYAAILGTIPQGGNTAKVLADASQIGDLYSNILGRAPDTAGFLAQLAAAEGGTSLATLAQNIAGSAENKTAPTGSYSFVDSLYHNILGRDPDAAGRAWQQGALAGTDGLARPLTREELATNVMNSAENKARLGGTTGTDQPVTPYPNTPTAPTPPKIPDYLSILSPGYENRLVPDDVGRGYIDEILNTGFNDASSDLSSYLQRGQLNNNGFDRAMNILNDQRASARSKLLDYSSDIINKERSTLTGFGNDARTNYATDPTNPFIGDIGGQATASANDFITNFKPKLQAQIGGTPLFDVSSAFQQAGQNQGYTNPGSNALFNSIYNNNQYKYAPRGPGTASVF